MNMEARPSPTIGASEAACLIDDAGDLFHAAYMAASSIEDEGNSAAICATIHAACDLLNEARRAVKALEAEREHTGQAHAILMALDNLPGWRGPGLYEIDQPSGPRIVFIDPVPAIEGRRDHWFTVSACLRDRARRGSFSMSSEKLIARRIVKVGDITMGLQS